MRRPRLLLPLLVAGALGATAVACSSSDGRELPPPKVPQTTASIPEIGPSSVAQGVFTMASPSFADGAEIPAQFTCGGEGLSPALSWTGTPLDTTSLALVVRDLNAGGFVHWVVTGIDPFVQGVGEDGLPENAVEGLNGSGATGWVGPCPPAGSGVHTYQFALLALAEPVDLLADTPAEEAATLLEETAIERAVLNGTVASG